MTDHEPGSRSASGPPPSGPPPPGGPPPVPPPGVWPPPPPGPGSAPPPGAPPPADSTYSPYSQSTWGGSASPSPLTFPGRLAGVGIRFGALIIDSLLLLIPLLAVLVPLVIPHIRDQVLAGQPVDVAGALGAWALLVGIIYEAYFGLMVAAYGASIGQRLVGIRVVRAEDGGAVPLERALVRATIWSVPAAADAVPVLGNLLGLAALIGFLWVFANPRRMGAHDLMARTVVIHAPAPY